jgi:hypothetical protein
MVRTRRADATADARGDAPPTPTPAAAARQAPAPRRRSARLAAQQGEHADGATREEAQGAPAAAAARKASLLLAFASHRGARTHAA